MLPSTAPLCWNRCERKSFPLVLPAGVFQDDPARVSPHNIERRAIIFIAATRHAISISGQFFDCHFCKRQENAAGTRENRAGIFAAWEAARLKHNASVVGQESLS
jgi:hypothetical protein